MQSYTIVIADDYPLVRAGVRAVFTQEERYQVIGEACRRYEAFELVQSLQPNLLILDLVMDVSLTSEWLRQCHSVCPQLKILILCALTDVRYVVTMRTEPVAGFLLKEEASECLLPAVQAIECGSTWYSQRVTQLILQAAEEQRRKHPYRLTPREQQVFELMVRGETNANIASGLEVSIHTVRRCATLIYQKAGFRGRTEGLLHTPRHDP